MDVFNDYQANNPDCPIIPVIREGISGFRCRLFQNHNKINVVSRIGTFLIGFMWDQTEPDQGVRGICAHLEGDVFQGDIEHHISEPTPENIRNYMWDQIDSVTEEMEIPGCYPMFDDLRVIRSISGNA